MTPRLAGPSDRQGSRCGDRAGGDDVPSLAWWTRAEAEPPSRSAPKGLSKPSGPVRQVNVRLPLRH